MAIIDDAVAPGQADDPAIVDDATWLRIAGLEADCLVLVAGGASVFRSLGSGAVRICRPELHVSIAADPCAQGEIAAVLFHARSGDDHAAVLGVVRSAGKEGLCLAVQQVELARAAPRNVRSGAA